jgi:aryl-alcohol dehydrogenase-like predicted oxidoreductase
MSSSSAACERDRARLVVGTASIGQPYGLASADGAPPALPALPAVAELFRAAWRAGIRTVDTAPAYGLAEERLGAILTPEVRVWTKLDSRMPLDGGLSAAAEKTIARSLERLRRRRLDLLQWHNWTPEVGQHPEFRGLWKTLGRDRRISQLGASTYGPDDALAAVESGRFSIVQVEWNLLNQSVLDAVGDRAKKHGVRLAARSVLLQGVLAGRRPPAAAEGLRRGVERLEALARECGVVLPVLAIRAALDHPSLSWVLVGLDDPAQLAVTLEAADRPALTHEQWALLRGFNLTLGHLTDPRGWPSSGVR